MSRPSTPAAPGSLYARFGAALIAEKLRILRTIRGLDRAGVDPATLAQIRAPLVRLADLDQMLTNVLDVLERDGCAFAAREGDDLVTTLPKLLGSGESARGAVADALPARFRRGLDRATGEVAVLEAEIWMQVDELREKSPATGGGRRRQDTRKPGPMSEAAVQRAADEAWAGSRTPPRPEGHAKVVDVEREPLPSDAAPLLAWFERMPPPWLQGIARVHDLPVAGATPLAARIATLFSSPGQLETILAGKMGASEREKLAIVLSVERFPLGAATSEASQAFEVAWDWTLGLPAHVGAKLRALGLVHVGTWAGARVATVPAPLRAPLTAALVAVDPDAADTPARAVGDVRATASQGQPFADPELARWKAIDKSLGDVFESWLEGGALSERAIIPFFGPGPRELETDAQRQALWEYVLFDWRAKPGAPTVGERALATTKFASPDHRAVAAATIAARPAVYRIERITPGVDLELVPVFPSGPAVRITDRAFSLSAQVGIWVPMRAYAAGPFHFFRLAGDPIARAQQPALEKALLRGARGRDPAAWIVEDPAAFFRVLRANSR